MRSYEAKNPERLKYAGTRGKSCEQGWIIRQQVVGMANLIKAAKMMRWSVTGATKEGTPTTPAENKQNRDMTHMWKGYPSSICEKVMVLSSVYLILHSTQVNETKYDRNLFPSSLFCLDPQDTFFLVLPLCPDIFFLDFFLQNATSEKRRDWLSFVRIWPRKCHGENWRNGPASSQSCFMFQLWNPVF